MKKWIGLAIVMATAWNLWAQAPEMFRYQGRLVDGTNLVNATLPMNFKLYDALSDGALLYEDSNSVLVVDGLYSTMIGDDTVSGSLTNALTNATVYLELTVDGETLSPRERLVSVPYALNVNGGSHTHDRIIALSDTSDSSGVPLDFGEVYSGSSKTERLHIQNHGDGVITVSGFEFSDSSFGSSIVWDNEYPAGKIPAYELTGVQISFIPSSAKEYNETVTVNCDYTSGTNTISITGTGLPARYIDNGDGTITDLATDLMWSKNANHGQMTWSNAMTYCENLVTNGYNDWRLPSVEQDGGVAELDTLFREGGDPSGEWERSKGYPFAGLTLSSNYIYWSSTSRASNEDQAWPVGMNSGGMYWQYPKTYDGFSVWPVRGGE